MQVVYIPAIVIAGTAVARLDGIRDTPVVLMFVPLWIIDAAMIVGEFLSCIACNADVGTRTFLPAL